MATETKNIKGTQTEKNLVNAYLSETQANARYIFYAKQAKKESYFPLEVVFNETAANELHHAKIFFKFLQGGSVTTTLASDAGIIGDTATNLQISIKEETEEGIKFYLEAADVADKEGFPEIASHFRAIAAVEDHHRARFEKYLKQVQDGTVWKRDTPIQWRCLVCGYIYEGTEPPQVCPACDHPYQHYMALDM